MKNIFGKLFKKISENEKNEYEIKLSNDLSENIIHINEQFGYSSDLSVNIFKNNKGSELSYATIYINQLVDKRAIDSISQEIITLLTSKNNIESYNNSSFFEEFRNMIKGTRKVTEGDELEKTLNEILSGSTIFLVDGYNTFIAINAQDHIGRSIDEPTSQTVIRGSKEAFTENIDTNMSLVRKRIKNKQLRVEELTLGTITNTRIAFIYLDNISKPEIRGEIKRRLSNIKIDAILEGSYIEELIADDKYSIFPTILNSERPDAVSSAILEGRIAIIVDGTPYVLTVPAFVSEFFQVSEDYYQNFIISSGIRLLRYLSFVLSVFIPSLYISLLTFHQEIIPTPLLISIAAQRDGVPFPVLLEVLLMELTFEILREAGIRMPRAVGSAISIVGVLVLGQAAVDAGIISAATVIILSITAITSFVIPNYSMMNTSRILKFVFIVLSGFVGLYGIFMGIIILQLHLCKLKTIGLPYLSFITPTIKGKNIDIFVRAPLWMHKCKPSILSNSTSQRVNTYEELDTKTKKCPEFGSQK